MGTDAATSGARVIRTSRWLRIGIVMGIAMVAMTCIYPFLVMVSIALTPEVDAMRGDLIPAEPTLKSFREIWEVMPFAIFYINSLFIALTVTALQLTTSSMAAYAFSRLRWRGRDKIFLGYLATLMVPTAVTMVPVSLMMRHFGWIDSYKAIILPAAFTAYGTFLLRQYFLSIPRDLEEAAHIDGAGFVYIFFRIILPLSKPALSTLAILTFMSSWRMFMWPLIVINTTEKMPLYVGLASLQGIHNTRWSLIMAGATLALLPVVAVFLMAQKYFVEGIQLGAIKG